MGVAFNHRPNIIKARHSSLVITGGLSAAVPVTKLSHVTEKAMPQDCLYDDRFKSCFWQCFCQADNRPKY